MQNINHYLIPYINLKSEVIPFFIWNLYTQECLQDTVLGKRIFSDTSLRTLVAQVLGSSINLREVTDAWQRQCIE